MRAKHELNLSHVRVNRHDGVTLEPCSKKAAKNCQFWTVWTVRSSHKRQNWVRSNQGSTWVVHDGTISDYHLFLTQDVKSKHHQDFCALIIIFQHQRCVMCSLFPQNMMFWVVVDDMISRCHKISMCNLWTEYVGRKSFTISFLNLYHIIHHSTDII